jgi:hypothetical protein
MQLLRTTTTFHHYHQFSNVSTHQQCTSMHIQAHQAVCSNMPMWFAFSVSYHII